MYITKQKETHGYREETSGYQWGGVRWDGQDKSMRLRVTNYYV